MLPMQTNKSADGADEAFGGSPVRDDLTGQHRIQQLRQLRVENPIQRRTHRTTHRPHPLGENQTTPCVAVPAPVTTRPGQPVPGMAERQAGSCNRRLS